MGRYLALFCDFFILRLILYIFFTLPLPYDQILDFEKSYCLFQKMSFSLRLSNLWQWNSNKHFNINVHLEFMVWVTPLPWCNAVLGRPKKKSLCVISNLLWPPVPCSLALMGSRAACSAPLPAADECGKVGERISPPPLAFTCGGKQWCSPSLLSFPCQGPQQCPPTAPAPLRSVCPSFTCLVSDCVIWG